MIRSNKLWTRIAAVSAVSRALPSSNGGSLPIEQIQPKFTAISTALNELSSAANMLTQACLELDSRMRELELAQRQSEPTEGEELELKAV